MMKQTRSNALKPMAVLGVMSGTSIDAVDYALCKITPNAIKLLEHWQVTFPSSLQKQLHAAAANGHVSCMEALLKLGADLKVLDGQVRGGEGWVLHVR